jgi:putative spermidine/putrescine transport system substrate-binding protein
MSGRVSRRDLVRRLAFMGLSLPAISAILAACGGNDNTPASSSGGSTSSTSAATATKSTAASTTTTSAGSTTSASPAASAASPASAGSPAAGTGSSSTTTSSTGTISGATPGQFKGKTLIVTSYGGPWEEFLRNEVLPDFEKETGGKIELAVGLSKDWMTKLRAAGKDNPPYDVVIANETYISTARIEGSFVPLPEDKIPNLKDVHPNMKLQDNIGVFALISPVGIAWITDKVTGAEPASWLDLKNYTGKLGIYNASNSACAQHIMMMAKIQTGDYKNWQAGFDWIKNNLKPNKQTDFSGDMEKLLTTGEVDVGILDAPAWARLSSGGVKMKYVNPKEGILMFEQNTNVTAGSKNKDFAFAFVNYLLSEQIQTKFMKGFWYTASNTKVKPDADLAKLIPLQPADLGSIQKWDYVWLNTGVRDDMINRWNREMSS